MQIWQGLRLQLLNANFAPLEAKCRVRRHVMALGQQLSRPGPGHVWVVVKRPDLPRDLALLGGGCD